MTLTHSTYAVFMYRTDTHVPHNDILPSCVLLSFWRPFLSSRQFLSNCKKCSGDQNQRGWGNIFRSMIPGWCISGRRCTGGEVRFNETKAAKGAAVAGGWKRRGNIFKSAGIEWELRHRLEARQGWAQSEISKRRKSLREERILNRRGQGGNTVDINWKRCKWARAQHTCLWADIYKSEQVIASAKVGQNRTLKMRESDRKLGYLKEGRQREQWRKH